MCRSSTPLREMLTDTNEAVAYNAYKGANHGYPADLKLLVNLADTCCWFGGWHCAYRILMIAWRGGRHFQFKSSILCLGAFHFPLIKSLESSPYIPLITIDADPANSLFD